MRIKKIVVGNCRLRMDAELQVHRDKTGELIRVTKANQIDRRCVASLMKEGVNSSNISIEQPSISATCLMTRCPYFRKESR